MNKWRPESITNFQAARPQSPECGKPKVHGRSCQSQFAAAAAARISALENEYSLLNQQTLAQTVSAWYEASTEAMFDGHHTSLDRWLREQVDFVSRSGWNPDDLLQLLRVCRSTAMEMERWNEDVLSLVDEVINETLSGLAEISCSPKNDPRGRLTVELRITPPPAPIAPSKSPSEKMSSPSEPAEPPGAPRPAVERRGVPRVRLELPIGVSELYGGRQEVTRTQNVSKAGLNFVARHGYTEQAVLRVVYPYWENAGVSSEIPAEVIRTERLPDGSRFVAIRFLKPVASKPKAKTK